MNRHCFTGEDIVASKEGEIKCSNTNPGFYFLLALETRLQNETGV
jgi:hypothetical protein